MIKLRAAALLLLGSSLAPLLSGCGAELAATTALRAGQQVNAAKNGVQKEEEAKKQVIEAMEIAAKNRAASMNGSPPPPEAASAEQAGNPQDQFLPAPTDASAAMRAAEEQAK